MEDAFKVYSIEPPVWMHPPTVIAAGGTRAPGAYFGECYVFVPKPYQEFRSKRLTMNHTRKMPEGIDIGTQFMLKEALAQGELELRLIYQSVLEKIGRTDAFLRSRQCVEQDPNHILAAMWMRGDFKSELLHIMETTHSDSLGEHLEMIKGLPSIVVK